MRDDTHTPVGHGRAAGPRATWTLIPLAAAAMAFWTWGTWPDAVSDSGRELYVAWQLAAGRVLYRDVAYFNGPLSAYVNAAWFALAGPGIAVLEIANAIVLAVIAALTWRLVRAMAGPGEASAAVLLFVTVFAFGPLTLIGSFTYLLPYSHEMTHGLLLILALLAVLRRALDRPDARSAIAAGGLAGLAFLTKPEFAIAASAVLLTGFPWIAWRGRGARRLASLLAAGVAVPLLAWAMLAVAMPGRVALDGVLGSWTHLTDERLTGMPYFRLFMGTDHPWAHVGALVAWSLVWAAVAAAAVAAGRLAGRFARQARVLAVTAAVVVAAALVAVHDLIPWYDAFRPLPVAALAVLAWAVFRLARAPRTAPRDHRLVLIAAAAAGALALTLKMILFARVWHYGFVLGMPAAMLSVAAMTGVVRHRCRVSGGSLEVASGVLIGVLVGTIGGHLFVMAPILGARTVSVGTGRDAFRSDSRGLVVNGALAAIEKESPPGATLAVLPDGVMLSYLARRPNSTPYVIGNPADLAIFGEAPMLAAYRASPPDLLALAKCDTTIYGFPRGFGGDYARALGAWIAETYEPVGMVGTDEGDDSFRIALLRRKGYSNRRSSSTKDESGANVSSR